jgi:hypothetical protein
MHTVFPRQSPRCLTRLVLVHERPLHLRRARRSSRPGSPPDRPPSVSNGLVGGLRDPLVFPP